MCFPLFILFLHLLHFLLIFYTSSPSTFSSSTCYSSSTVFSSSSTVFSSSYLLFISSVHLLPHRSYWPFSAPPFSLSQLLDGTSMQNNDFSEKASISGISQGAYISQLPYCE